MMMMVLSVSHYNDDDNHVNYLDFSWWSQFFSFLWWCHFFLFYDYVNYLDFYDDGVASVTSVAGALGHLCQCSVIPKKLFGCDNDHHHHNNHADDFDEDDSESYHGLGGWQNARNWFLASNTFLQNNPATVPVQHMCVHINRLKFGTLLRGGKYGVVHPKRPRDFARTKGNLEGVRLISRLEWMYNPIHPNLRQCTTILSSLIHP